MKNIKKYDYRTIIRNKTYRFLAPIFLNVPFNSIRKIFIILYGARIGKGVFLARGVDIRDPKGLSIGNYTTVNKHTVLDGRGKLTIGDNVDIAQDTIIWTAQHDYNDDYHKYICAPVIIGDYVWIGARAMVLPGISIGRGAVIAAGAVVTKNVDDLYVVGGVPAKMLSVRTSQLLYTLHKDSRHNTQT